MPREVIDHFSQRRAEIVAEMDLHGTRSLAAGNAAALATRKGKDYGVPMDRLRDEWRARAAEHGLTQADVERMLTPRWRELPEPRDVDLDTLTAHSATFTRREALQAVCEAHPQGAASVVELEAKADELLRSPEVVRIPDPAGTRYTTRDQLALERGLLQGAQQRRNSGTAVAEAQHVEQALEPRKLSDEQARVVRDLTTSGHGVEVLRAPSGAGKTFALDAAREAWQAGGREVVGCALSAQATRELREQAGIDTFTIAQLHERINRGYRLPEDGVLIVDEAGMAGTRDLATLEVWTLQTKTKLLLVGDDRQLPEIEAGGAFRAIAEQVGAAELTEVHRQDADWDRRALAALRDGKPADWAAAYIEHARITTAETAPELRDQLVADWWQAREAGADARMLALRRVDVADLNQRARQRMRDAGHLHGQDVQIGPRAFATGDEVVVTHNQRRLGILNGDRGRVLDAQPTHVEVELAHGTRVEVPASFIADGHLDHGYATTAHKAQGATVDQAFVLGSQEAYREWGYTALSRHREQARYYVCEPKPFLNREPVSLDDPEQLELNLTQDFEDSRRHELAIEAIERFDADPDPPQERERDLWGQPAERLADDGLPMDWTSTTEPEAAGEDGRPTPRPGEPGHISEVRRRADERDAKWLERLERERLERGPGRDLGDDFGIDIGR